MIGNVIGLGADFLRDAIEERNNLDVMDLIYDSSELDEGRDYEPVGGVDRADAIKSGELVSQLALDCGAPPTLDSRVAAEESGTEISNPSIIAKYNRMVSVGVPLAAVENRMKQDGVIQSIISKIISAATQKIQIGHHRYSNGKLEWSLEGSEPAPLEKYSKMISIGLTEASVIHKMEMDGVCQSEIQAFQQANCSSEIVLHVEAFTVRCTKSQPRVSDDKPMRDGVLSKYVKMASMGVPPSGVVNKLSLECVNEEIIELFRVKYDLAMDKSAERGRLGETKDFLCPLSPPSTSRSSVNLQKIHRKEVAQEKLQDSLWEKHDFAESDVDQSALKLLESLFGAQSQSKA